MNRLPNADGGVCERFETFSRNNSSVPRVLRKRVGANRLLIRLTRVPVNTDADRKKAPRLVDLAPAEERKCYSCLLS